MPFLRHLMAVQMSGMLGVLPKVHQEEGKLCKSFSYTNLADADDIKPFQIPTSKLKH
jgi:hypothetical protein